MVAQLVRKKKDFSTFSNISANGDDDNVFFGRKKCLEKYLSHELSQNELAQIL